MVLLPLPPVLPLLPAAVLPRRLPAAAAAAAAAWPAAAFAASTRAATSCMQACGVCVLGVGRGGQQWVSKGAGQKHVT